MTAGAQLEEGECFNCDIGLVDKCPNFNVNFFANKCLFGKDPSQILKECKPW